MTQSWLWSYQIKIIKKTFVMLKGFWSLRGFENVGLSLLKKGKFVTKIFFQILLNEILKSRKNSV